MAQESRMAGALGRFLCRLHAFHDLDASFPPPPRFFLAILMGVLVYLTAEPFARFLAILSCLDSGREEIPLAVLG